MTSLKGCTLLVTGGSRGIGLSIALRAARDGANVAIAAKTVEPHPRLPSTIYSAAEAVERAGGRALPLQVDIRDEGQVEAAVEATVKRFGGIDCLVNNASAISLTNTLATPMKRYDLLMSVNVRGTYLCSRTCLPHLAKSSNPHILTLSPPLNLRAEWFKGHTAYTISKFGMSMCVIGMAEDFREQGVAVNGLWPRTIIATAALNMIPGTDTTRARREEIMADAAWHILTKDSRSCTGNLFVDEQVLAAEGVTDFAQYNVTPGVEPLKDLFID